MFLYVFSLLAPDTKKKNKNIEPDLKFFFCRTKDSKAVCERD